MFLLILMLVFFAVSAEKDSESILGVHPEKNKIIINDNNWKQILQGEWIIGFFMPECKKCKAAEDVWSKLPLKSKELGVNVGYVDANSSPSLQARFLVTSFPRAFHIKDGIVRDYMNPLNMEQLEAYLEKKLWEKDSPVPFWRSPQFFSMTVFSSCYHLAVSMWNYQDELFEKHGIPNWMSYILFTIAFVTVGTIIGLLGVCLTDIIALTNVFKFPCKTSAKNTAIRNVPKEKPMQENQESVATESKKSK